MIAASPPHTTSSNAGINGANNEVSVRVKFGKGHIRFEQLTISAERAAAKRDVPTTTAKAILYPLPRSPETAETVAKEFEVYLDQALRSLTAESSSTNIPAIHSVKTRTTFGKSDLDTEPSSDDYGETFLVPVLIAQHDGYVLHILFKRMIASSACDLYHFFLACAHPLMACCLPVHQP
jgi:hypothetical protein